MLFGFLILISINVLNAALNWHDSGNFSVNNILAKLAIKLLELSQLSWGNQED